MPGGLLDRVAAPPGHKVRGRDAKVSLEVQIQHEGFVRVSYIAVSNVFNISTNKIEDIRYVSYVKLATISFIAVTVCVWFQFPISAFFSQDVFKGVSLGFF